MIKSSVFATNLVAITPVSMTGEYNYLYASWYSSMINHVPTPYFPVVSVKVYFRQFRLFRQLLTQTAAVSSQSVSIHACRTNHDVIRLLITVQTI